MFVQKPATQQYYIHHSNKINSLHCYHMLTEHTQIVTITHSTYITPHPLLSHAYRTHPDCYNYTFNLHLPTPIVIPCLQNTPRLLQLHIQPTSPHNHHYPMPTEHTQIVTITHSTYISPHPLLSHAHRTHPDWYNYTFNLRLPTPIVIPCLQNTPRLLQLHIQPTSPHNHHYPMPTEHTQIVTITHSTYISPHPLLSHAHRTHPDWYNYTFNLCLPTPIVIPCLQNKPRLLQLHIKPTSPHNHHYPMPTEHTQIVTITHSTYIPHTNCHPMLTEHTQIATTTHSTYVSPHPLLSHAYTTHPDCYNYTFNLHLPTSRLQQLHIQPTSFTPIVIPCLQSTPRLPQLHIQPTYPHTHHYPMLTEHTQIAIITHSTYVSPHPLLSHAYRTNPDCCNYTLNLHLLTTIIIPCQQSTPRLLQLHIQPTSPHTHCHPMLTEHTQIVINTH